MRVKFFALTIIAFTWLFYFAFFNQWDDLWDFFDPDKWNGFSNSKSDWGTFGDYVGGVLNPILSFISIIMLINSINLQREANNSLIVDSKRQSKLEEKRSFEVSFYNLIEAEREEFKQLELVLPYGTFKSVKAVTELENYISNYIDDNSASMSEISTVLGEIDENSGMAIYSVVRGFYVLTKLINEKCPNEDREHYIDVCVSLTPVRAINILVIAAVYFDWKNISYMKENFPEFFEKAGIKNSIDYFYEMHD